MSPSLRALERLSTIICLHTVKCFQVLRCITNNSIKHHSFVYTQLNGQTVLFQAILLTISHLFALSLNNQTVIFDPMDRTLSGATTLGQSRPGSNGNKGVLHIPQTLQHYWILTVTLFDVISRTIVGGWWS